MTASSSRRIPRFVFMSNSGRLSGDAERFGWRLVAANNRPMGRGIRVATSLERCRAAADTLHRAAGEAAQSAVVEVANGRWTWRVGVDGMPAAVSVHRYLRRVECLRALTQFVAALELADPAFGVVRHFGPDSLRAYDPADGPEAEALLS